MRHRLPLFLACLMILPALLVAGCGSDDTSSSTPAEDTSTQESATGATSDSATASAQRTLDTCLETADKLPDSTKAEEAKQKCQAAYDNIADANKKIDEKTQEAVKKCKDAANKIPDEGAKASALAACDKFQ